MGGCPLCRLAEHLAESFSARGAIGAHRAGLAVGPAARHSLAMTNRVAVHRAGRQQSSGTGRARSAFRAGAARSAWDSSRTGAGLR